MHPAVSSDRSRPTVLHLAGSRTDSGLAELSRVYAAGCLEALRDPRSRWSGHRHLVAWVDPDGSWRFPEALDRRSVEGASPVDIGTAVTVLRHEHVVVALPQMFCRAGMTDYRALLGLLGIPYAGNTPTVMAIGADKALARTLVAAAGVQVPEGVVLDPDHEPHVAAPGLPSYPLVVKPVDADNSDGLTLVTEPGRLAAAVVRAREHSDRVLVEAYVELGREVRCGVVDLDGELVPLPLEEYAVDPVTKPVRDRSDKLRAGADGTELVAKDADHAWIVAGDDPVTAAVHEAALRCYRTLGCRHHGLFDFRVDRDGGVWFLEAGLYCSFAPASVVVTMARAAGLGIDDLLDAAVAPAHTVPRPVLSPADR